MFAANRVELEEIYRQVILVLYDGLNNEIDELQAEWTARDQQFWALMDREREIEVEHIESNNFYPGHTPSLINAPVERYPNCSAYTFQARPQGSGDDQGEMYDVRLAVEVMCKSSLDEQEVNSRVHRTVDAAQSVLRREGPRKLGGYVSGLADSSPIITVGDVFVRREEKSRGPRWFWQGGRLEYRLDRFVQD